MEKVYKNNSTEDEKREMICAVADKIKKDLLDDKANDVTFKREMVDEIQAKLLEKQRASS